MRVAVSTEALAPITDGDCCIFCGSSTFLMGRYLDKIMPNVGETWRADELYVKFSGKMNYVFAMMDHETRFWIAQQVTEKKGTSDVRPLFREARERAGKKSMLLITDGAANFAEANKKEYQTRYAEGSINHVRDIRIDGTVHNNKNGRMNEGLSGLP